jgi:hypothetical protein
MFKNGIGHMKKKHIIIRHHTYSSNPDFDTSETFTAESGMTTRERKMDVL